MPRVVGRPHFRERRTMGASPVTSGQLARRFVASPGVTMPCSTSGVLVDSLKSARRPGSTPSGVETLCEMQVGVPWAFPAPMAPKRFRSRALYDLQTEDGACAKMRTRRRACGHVCAWVGVFGLCGRGSWFGTCARGSACVCVQSTAAAAAVGAWFGGGWRRTRYRHCRDTPSRPWRLGVVSSRRWSRRRSSHRRSSQAPAPP